MMDVDFVQRIMREKSCPSEKVSSPKSGLKGKQRKFRNKYNPNNGKSGKDPRDLLATVNDQFNDPEYLNEIGMHLKEDIEKIKKEVIPLRQRLHIFMKMEEKAENLPPEAVTLDILDPQPKKNVDVSQRANQLNIAITDLDSQLNAMQKYYCEKTKIELKNDISIHQEKISDLNSKIDCMNEAIRLQNKQMEELMKSKTREKVDHYKEKINSLTFLLNEMKEEQQEDIDHHFAIICQREADPALKNQLSALQRQLNSLQYIKAQRLVELNKQMKRYETQKKCVSAVIERHIQSSKNSSRNAKMSKRFTRELNNEYNPSRESRKRLTSQNSSSSSSDYSLPENDPDNIYKRKYRTNKNDKISEEQSDIYYLEDAEVQTKEIDFNSLVSASFGADSEKGLRFRHHRRRVRKHPKRDQQNSGASQDEDINEKMEINYDFPTNIQFLQFPSSSRAKLKMKEQEEQNRNRNILIHASIETDDCNKSQVQIAEQTKPNENNNTNSKSGIEFLLDFDKSMNKSRPMTTSNDNNMNTTPAIFHTEESTVTAPNQQIQTQPVSTNINDETDMDISLNVQEISKNDQEEKAKTFPLDNPSSDIQKEETENNEIISNEIVLDNDTDTDPNNSGIRISESFAEHALNIIGHSKFVLDTEEEEIHKNKDQKQYDSQLKNTDSNLDQNSSTNNCNNENECPNIETYFPRPRDSSIPKVIQQAKYITDSIDEEDDNSKTESDPFSPIRNNLPCTSLSIKGSCCTKAVETGP